ESISGEVNWTNRVYSVPSGSQLLEWRYTKNSRGAAGQDRGWVDQIQYSGTPPTITTQPASQNVDQGANVVFTVAVTSPTTLSYQWHFNGVSLTDGVGVSGARTAT